MTSSPGQVTPVLQVRRVPRVIPISTKCYYNLATQTPHAPRRTSNLGINHSFLFPFRDILDICVPFRSMGAQS